MRRTVVIVLVLAGCVFAQPAHVVVLNPERAEILSQGEIGVMLDAIARQVNKSQKFRTVPLQKLQSVLDETGRERVNVCPDKTCLREIALALSADYVLSFCIDKKERPFEVELVMYDVVKGEPIAQTLGKYNGPKSQLPLKFIPRKTKELVRVASPLVSVAWKPKKEAAPAAIAEQPGPPADETEEPLMPAQEGQEQPKKSVLRSPGFWIPMALAILAPVAIVVVVTQVRGADDDGGDEMPLPEFPHRPDPTALAP